MMQIAFPTHIQTASLKRIATLAFVCFTLLSVLPSSAHALGCLRSLGVQTDLDPQTRDLTVKLDGVLFGSPIRTLSYDATVSREEGVEFFERGSGKQQPGLFGMEYTERMPRSWTYVFVRVRAKTVCGTIVEHLDVTLPRSDWGTKPRPQYKPEVL